MPDLRTESSSRIVELSCLSVKEKACCPSSRIVGAVAAPGLALALPGGSVCAALGHPRAEPTDSAQRGQSPDTCIY